MTKLCLKIFFYFWLLSGLILIAGLLYETTHHRTPLSLLAGQKHPVSPAVRLTNDLLASVVSHDMRSLGEMLAHSPQRITQHIYLLDQDNRDLLNRTLPEAIKPLASQLDDQQLTAELGDNIGRLVTLTDGTQLKAITYIEPGTHIFFKIYFLNALPWLLSGMLVSALASYIFARILSRDLTMLKNATRSIAAGNLAVRIAPKFKHTAFEFTALAVDFDHMAERLETAMHHQRRLIKDVSHELRSPLARLQVALELASDRSHGVVDKELNTIRQAADSLEEIITQILSMPITEHDHYDLEDTIDLVSMLEALVEQNLEDAENKHVAIKLDAKPLEILVATRGNILNSVFENILRNAIRYTNSNSTITITLAYKERGRVAQIDIEDEGPGVPEADLSYIFQPFFRSDSARSRDLGGYGLGLAIAERTVEVHGGKISASNHQPTGLAVRVILPVAQKLEIHQPAPYQPSAQ
ncbi:ATP-binding protein [Halioxenophilus sp. WMMB6]|uniref:ATP-binding protein n=1 Tax=Halioxenophilus sp. WMMB6 TaxID=3073815 RepID=UPI00295E729F|nr:ATP-binding protein [Halioxenophilus sp. WMMB6]